MQTTSLGRLIPLSAISPSSTNPRKRFNESDLAELAKRAKKAQKQEQSESANADA